MANLNQKTILLVDDDEIVVMLEMEQLVSQGYDVVHASTGEEAVDLIIVKKLPVDLILMDIDLGSGMNGLQTATEIQKHLMIPILFLSSHSESEFIKKSEDISGYGYVEKNTSFTALKASIKSTFKIVDITAKRAIAEKQILLLTRLYATLSQINQTVSHIKDQSDLFGNICEDILKFGEIRLAWIGLLDPANGNVLINACAGQGEDYVRSLYLNIHDPVTGSGPTCHAIKSGTILISKDIQGDDKFPDRKVNALKYGYLSSVSVPIRLRDEVIGVLSLHTTLSFFFDNPEEIRLLEKIGHTISFALEAIDVNTKREQMEARINHHNRILQLLVAKKPLQEILITIVRDLETMNPSVLYSILLLDKDGKHLHLGAAPSLPDFYNAAIDGLSIGDAVGSCGTAAFKGERVIVQDIDTHPYWTQFRELASRAQLKACWSEPIFSEKRTILGTFAIYKREVSQPTPYDLQMISDEAWLVALAIEKTTTDTRLELVAHFDTLTGLPNQVLLAEKLTEAILRSEKSRKAIFVAYFDLDDFKLINDTYGHTVGDKLLIQISSRWKAELSDGDTLCRIGGDEFVALIENLEDPLECEQLLFRLLECTAKPVTIDGEIIQVTTSMGVTSFPNDKVNTEHLIRHADQALFLSKHAGKNCFHYFDVAYDLARKKQKESLDDIRRALTQDEFVLYYQPKVNMKTGAVTGAEALIRWIHPERGLIPPIAFLPFIEDHPISVELGEWVIDTALKQISIWENAGLFLEVSVNVGARQLQQSNFPERLAILLASHPKVKPKSLQLEILETSSLEDIKKVSSIIEACQALGVSFALDDFGTGYSSLTYLKHLPVQILKIDQSFIRELIDYPENLAIIKSIISLADAFRREVIAEGVETIAHGILLLAHGCKLAQGFAIARPMPAASLPDWAKAWRPDSQWSI